MINQSVELDRFKKLLRRFGLKGQVYTFFSNLTILLDSGISIPEALASIRQETSSSRMKGILHEIENDLRHGMSFATALNQRGILPPRIYTLLKVGEESGRLVDNLELINTQNDKEIVFRSKVRSSLLYALVVLIVAIVVMLVTSLVILPRLAKFYSELEVELPTLTKALIVSGSFLADYGFVLLPLTFIAIMMVLYFLFSFPKTRYIGHSLLFHVPLVQRLLKYSEVSSFGFMLGSGLKSGVSMLHVLRDMPTTTTFKNYQKFYHYLADKVERGSSLHDALKEYPKINRLIPSQAITIIAAGERSGKLPDSFLRIAEIYERKVDTIAKNLPTIIEPVIILIIGAFIAVIALATILPIYSLNSVF